MTSRREFALGAAAFAAALRGYGASVSEAGEIPAWLAEKISAAYGRYRTWKGADETVVFPIISDLHDWHPDLDPAIGPRQAAKMHIPYLLEVGERFDADFVADLGDIGSDHVRTPERKIRGATRAEQRRRWQSQFALYDRTKRPVFCCVGNHDLGYREDGKGQTVDPAEFGTFFAPLAHGADVVWGEGRHYGYWDVPGKKCRVIVLDNFEYRHSYGFKKGQLAFLAKALVVPADFTVVALMHANLDLAFGCWLRKDGTMSFRDAYNGVYGRFGMREAKRMFEDFVAHGSGAVNGTSWDFTALKGNRLSGILCGHTHYDNEFKCYDVLQVCRQGFGSLSTKSEMPHENGARHNEVILKSDQTCLDVVAIKPKTAELRIFRIGAGDEKADL